MVTAMKNFERGSAYKLDVVVYNSSGSVTIDAAIRINYYDKSKGPKNIVSSSKILSAGQGKLH